MTPLNAAWSLRPASFLEVGARTQLSVCAYVLQPLHQHSPLASTSHYPISGNPAPSATQLVGRQESCPYPTALLFSSAHVSPHLTHPCRAKPLSCPRPASTWWHHTTVPPDLCLPSASQGTGMDQSFVSSSRAAPTAATVMLAVRGYVGCMFPSATPGSLETPHCLGLLQVSHMLRFAEAALHCLAASLFPIVPLLH